jgi:hypothetical protein
MKKYFFYLAIFVGVLSSCKTDKPAEPVAEEQPSKVIEEVAPLPMKSDTIQTKAPEKLDIKIPEKKAEKAEKKK